MGHHINSYEEFQSEVGDMMTLGLLRVATADENNQVRMVTGFNRKEEVCRYQPTKGGPPRMILAKPASINSGNYNALIIMETPFISQNPFLCFMLK